MSLEDRIKNLEDIEAIKRLKHRYCYDNDSNNGKAVRDMFTDDAVWDGGAQFGVYKGDKELTEFFATKAPYEFYVHAVLNPIIEVKGDEGTGIWYLIEPATLENGQAVWICGRYDEKYVRIGGRWKFKEICVKSFFVTPFEKGWHKEQFIK